MVAPTFDGGGSRRGSAAAASPAWPVGARLPREAASIGLAELLSAMGLAPPGHPWLEDDRYRLRVVRRGEVLCREGEPLRFVYPVLGGVLKASAITESGREQVFGLLRHGDVAGIDSVGRADHRSTLAAVEPARVAVLPFQSWCRLGHAVPQAEAMLQRAFQREIDRHLALNRLLGIANVRCRVAAFLLMLAARPDGACDEVLRLPLSRLEIAQLLGTTQESVCRALSALAAAQLIGLRRGVVAVLHPEALRGLVARPLRRAAKHPGLAGARAPAARGGSGEPATPAALG